MCHRKSIVEDSNLVEVRHRTSSKTFNALHELPFGLANMHVHHRVEVVSELHATNQLFRRAAMWRGRAHNRQHKLRPTANVLREAKKLVERLPSLMP